MPVNRLPSAEEVTDVADLVLRLMRVGHEVLLYCSTGIDRAPLVACAVLAREGVPYRVAVAQVEAACQPAVFDEARGRLLRQVPPTPSDARVEVVGAVRREARLA